MFLTQLDISSKPEVESHIECKQTVVEESDIYPPTLQISNRVCHTPEFYGLHINTGYESLVDHDENTSYDSLVDHGENISYQKAMVGPKNAKWKETMENEIKLMFANQV